MTSWVLSIDKDHPQHWRYAKREQVWDLRTRRNLRRGDTVYFWQAGASLVGRGRVATDVHDSPSAGLPWDDGGDVIYNGRVTFEWLEDYSGESLSWAEVKQRTGIPGGPNLAPHTDSSIVEQRLSALFEAAVNLDDADLPRTIDDAIAQLAAPEIITLEADELATDRRERTLAAIRVRQGQPAFRDTLLAAYDSRCAVTGSTTVQVLEAAHIMPYKGRHTNVVQNGLLLRSDIHTLFDRHLLGIVPDHAYRLVTRLHPEIAGGDYDHLDGQPLRHLPQQAVHHPSPSYLRQHAELCGWL